MARAANQKLKCLYLWQFLLQNTDEEHPATIPQMIESLARHDIPAERKSLYDDIEALRQCGLDVEYRKAQGGGYYVASREFQLPELKLLVDEVDYDSLAETLLPLVQDKLRDSGGMLGGMLSGSPEMAAAMARTALRAMSQEKKDELLVQLVTKNRDKLLQKGGELAEKNGIKLHLYDVSARRI